MIRYYLIRHGVKESLREDPSLTEYGIKQARVTAEYFTDKNITAIYTSPMQRTKQTAEIINKKINAPIYLDKRLLERIEWEINTNESFDEFMDEWNKTQTDRTYEPVHGDSSEKTGNRVRMLLDEISETYKEGNFLIVSHGGAIGDFLQNVVSDGQFPKPIFNTDYIEISECSITELERKSEYLSLLRVNDVSHLPTPFV